MGHAWYLSAEFQMFICTPLLLIPMWHLRKRWGSKFSLAYCSVFVVGALVTSLAMTIVNDWSSSSFLIG